MKPVLAEGEQLPVWANASRHALAAGVGYNVTVDDTAFFRRSQRSCGVFACGTPSRVWAALPENGKLPVFTTGLENNQRIRIILPEVLFERLYTAENFQGNGPDYVTYRNQIYDLVADGLITIAVTDLSLCRFTGQNGRAFWPAPDQERQLVQKVSDPDHLARTLALDVAVELDPYAASGVTEQMLNFLIDSCWFALSQPAIPLPAAAEVRRHSLVEAQKIAAGDPTAPVASLTAPIDAMAVWLNQVGLTPQTQTSF